MLLSLVWYLWLLVPEGIIRPLVLSRFWLSCLGSLVFRFLKPLNYWAFQFGLPCADQKRDAYTGRYKNIPRHLRTCNKCGTLGDENHFFLNCKLNEHLRKAFLSDFDNINNTNLLEIILNPTNIKQVKSSLNSHWNWGQGVHDSICSIVFWICLYVVHCMFMYCWLFNVDIDPD